MTGGKSLELKEIGIIRSPFESQRETPIQPALSDGAQGSVEVFPEYAEGLKDLDGFSHIELIYYFDRAGEPEMLRRPFLDGEPHGIFAMRHFNRPNPIGMSTVRLLSVEGNILRVEGIDVVDGTPLLDIKPFVPDFRSPGEVRVGWLEDREMPSGEPFVPPEL